jgi:hypothetical protein
MSKFGPGRLWQEEAVYPDGIGRGLTLAGTVQAEHYLIEVRLQCRGRLPLQTVASPLAEFEPAS